MRISNFAVWHLILVAGGGFEPPAYIVINPLSYSQWWLGHKAMRLSMELISAIVTESSNSATDLICAISICLSYCTFFNLSRSKIS